MHIGIHIADTRIIAVKAEKKKNALAIHDAFVISLPDQTISNGELRNEAAFSSGLALLKENLNIRRYLIKDDDKVVISISDMMVRYGTIQIDEDDIVQAQLEADKRLVEMEAFLDAPISCFTMVSDSPGERKLSFSYVMTDENQLAPYLDAFQNNDIQISSIEPESIATIRYLSDDYQDDILLINAGVNGVSFITYSHAVGRLFSTKLFFGEAAILRSKDKMKEFLNHIQMHLELSQPALCTKLHNSLVGKIYITGTVHTDIINNVRSFTKLPTVFPQNVNPFIYGEGQWEPHEVPDYITATGLLLLPFYSEKFQKMTWQGREENEEYHGGELVTQQPVRKGRIQQLKKAGNAIAGVINRLRYP